MRDEEYFWMLDIPRIAIEAVLAIVLSPLFFITSFFLNNQEIYIVALTRFMSLKFVRLSGYSAA